MGEAASILIICLMAATLFVMAEMALASASKPKLRSKAKHGSRGAKAALQLIQQPSLYLSTVQIGITFTGISSAIFAGGPLSTELAARLESQPWLGGHAMVTAEFAVSFAIGSITIIFAELVPKRIALSRPETVAIWLSVPLSWLAWLAHPLVRILGWTADKVLSAIGCESISADEITSDELRSMVETSHASGHLSPSGKRIMLGALTLREITVAQVMTPAPRIV
jgi:putative hemolysin